jgi:hypothetical protein
MCLFILKSFFLDLNIEVRVFKRKSQVGLKFGVVELVLFLLPFERIVIDPLLDLPALFL